MDEDIKRIVVGALIVILICMSIGLNLAQLSLIKKQERQIDSYKLMINDLVDVVKDDPNYQVYRDQEGEGVYCELQENGECLGLFKKENKSFIKVN